VDRQRFDALIVEHLAAALGLAVRLTGDPHSAEDIVQEAMLRATKARRAFEDRSNFKTWLFRIVINVFRDSLRRLRIGVDDVEPNEVPSEDDPSIHLQEKELAAAVAQEISSLPPRQREVLILLTYEQLSTEAVAQLLGMTQQNVRTTLHLGRERLRRRLRHVLPERKT
jgi:RNA polymerase sigma-70 factor (ECF subfamily)